MSVSVVVSGNVKVRSVFKAATLAAWHCHTQSRDIPGRSSHQVIMGLMSQISSVWRSECPHPWRLGHSYRKSHSGHKSQQTVSVRESFIKKKKKSVTFFTLGSDPIPPLFCVKCDEKLIYFLSIIREYLANIGPIKIFYPQNHLKKYEKSAKI